MIKLINFYAFYCFLSIYANPLDFILSKLSNPYGYLTIVINYSDLI
jgi:hypothetical protein